MVRKAAKQRIQEVMADVEARSQQQTTSSRSESQPFGQELQTQLQEAVIALQKGLVERDTEVGSRQLWMKLCVHRLCSQYLLLSYPPGSLQVRLLLLAALAGEHILFIGPPGTAKSELGRRLATLYAGSFFERLLTRFSVPEVWYGIHMLLLKLMHSCWHCVAWPTAYISSCFHHARTPWCAATPSSAC